MAVGSVAGWRAVAAVSTALAGVATVVGLTLPIAIDHLWVVVALVVSAAVLRALGSGGARSVLALAGAVLVAQPGLHLLGEFLHHDDPDLAGHAGHAGLSGLLLLACHVVLTALLTAVLAAGESAVRTLVATFRRLVRVLVLSIVAAPKTLGSRTSAAAPDLSHEQRDGAPQPPRRGPPPALVPALP